MKKNDISLLISGELGFFCLKDLVKYTNLKFIATDKGSESIINFAKENNINLFVGNPRKGKLKEFIAGEKISLLLSINYLFIIEEDILSVIETAINFHGSLLPKYRGRTPHVWAIINNETESGITAHLIDNGCDTGKIILQKSVPILESDTGSLILKKFKNLYPQIIKEVFEMYSTSKIHGVLQDESLATYFGKRTPDDGLIDWNWQKERIRNWVRALSDPYPGAFTFFNQKKIIIDKISFSDLGYSDSILNGTILQVDPFIVIKTPNGSVKLEKIRNKEIGFLKGLILNS
jgi:methionyl-tRNA formyltransferase